MPSKHSQDTNYTVRVKSLTHQIFGKTHTKESMLDRATIYFSDQVVAAAHTEVDTNSVTFNKGQMKAEIERQERYEQLDRICRTILLLCEGDSFEEDNRKSSQLLATIQLLSPTEGPTVSLSNELNKPLYKAVICLRVLDRLCMDNRISDTYIKERLESISSHQYSEFSSVNPEGYRKFIEEVKIPLIKAALLQDIGNNHPDAQRILIGSDGTESPFRMLNVEERKKLLQIDYRETIKYLVEGVGVAKYLGRSKEDRDAFSQVEKHKLLFIKTLLKSSVNPKKGLGNLLKVPQIYTSMILSTKPNYDYGLLPKVYRVLYQNAERGVCHKDVVDAMYAITGAFPLGYGVTYLSENGHGEKKYSYEYAIVKQLYPEDPEIPICRTATRNLAFISFGQDLVIPKDRNLHFPEVTKKLHSISKDRTDEILASLSSNYTERQKLGLIPRYWFANEYFSVKSHQNLWNK